ncbi:trehalose-phosphatase [Thermomicrobium sp.]
MESIVAAMLAVLQETRAGIITDFDGTLSPIVTDPENATVHPVARRALQRLVTTVSLVAVVSGRRAFDVAERLAVPGLVIVGNHGLEWLVGNHVEVASEAEPWLAAVRAAAAELQRLGPDVLVEDKVLTVTVHLRRLRDASRRQAVESVVRRVAARRGLSVRQGREVLELRPPVPVDKGAAVARLVTRYQLGAVVFAGDDVTDLDAMRWLVERRATGQVHALVIGVWSPEAPAQLEQLADLLVPGVDAFAAVLDEVAHRLAGFQ